MELKYKLVFTTGKTLKEVALKDSDQVIIAGTDSDARARFRKALFYEPFSLRLTKGDGNWLAETTENCYLSSGDAKKRMALELSPGKEGEVHYQSSGLCVLRFSLMWDFDNAFRKYDYSIDISPKWELLIGGGSDCDIFLQEKITEQDRVRLIKKDKYWIADQVLTKTRILCNGNELAPGGQVRERDFLSIGPYSFFLKRGKLYTDLQPALSAGSLAFGKTEESLSAHVYPKYSRSARILEVPSEEKITILDPPEAPQEPKRNLMNQLLAPIIMLTVTVLSQGVMGNNGIVMAMMGAATAGVSIYTVLSNKKQEEGEYKKKVESREKVYRDYIARKEQEINRYRIQEEALLNRQFDTPAQEIMMVRNFSGDLFNRLPGDPGFVEIRLGSGKKEALRKIEYRPRERLEDLDELMKLPGKLAEEKKMLGQVPVTLKLRENGVVGIYGSRDSLYAMLRLLTLDLAVHHYSKDVSLLYCIGDEDRRQFSWIRSLPHIQNEELQRRNLICDEESRNVLLEYLSKNLMIRNDENSLPHLVLFLYRYRDIQTHPVSEYLSDAKKRGVTFLFFAENKEELPAECETLIFLSSPTEGVRINRLDDTKSVSFSSEMISDHDMDEVVRKLTPVRCEEISLEKTLTGNISFFDLYGIFEPEDIELGRTWKKSEVYRSMAVPLGIRTGDEIVYLDLHEKAHGPHGLVAGTTGSGKSEVLQSYIISMALHFHPYDAAFMIIDFKGGGMANQFRDLPHLAGTITNIDGREINRSLLSIRAELRKRQELFAKHGVNHIDAYIRLFKQGQAEVPLPHLILIVDEFAELKMDQPEFMKELISTARIGRSLGVHLILATQKPSGVVDPQIWSNSRFRLCLKVQTKEDSNEVLKNPLAAEITEPGRAYLQVGNNEILELIQSAYSGAPADGVGAEHSRPFRIYRILLSGKRQLVYERKAQKEEELMKTQLDAVVDYIRNYCVRENIPRLPYIILPPLPEKITLSQVKSGELPWAVIPREDTDREIGCRAFVGIIDDPDHQYQGVLELNVTGGNTIVIGSAQTGKTNLLQNIVRSLCERYSPSELNLYFLDFGSMILRNFDELAHVGGVVCANEDEKLRNLFKLLNAQLKFRKEHIAAAHVSSYSSYLEAGFTDLPQIVVLVDNFTAMREMYLSDQDFFLPLCREGVGFGISFVIAASQTAGLGYRYLSNFRNRIAFNCNDSSEYSTLFDFCRMRAAGIPGRCLTMQEKTVFEAQTFLAFEGEREIERAGEILSFVKEISRRFPNGTAARIPMVPPLLSEDVLQKEFGVCSDNRELILGVDYDSIEPIRLPWQGQGLLALGGKDGESRIGFVSYVLRCVSQMRGDIYLLDDFTGIFSTWKKDEAVRVYTRDSSDLKDMLTELKMNLESDYQRIASDGPEVLISQKVQLLVLTGRSAAGDLSVQKEALDLYREILEKYRPLKLLILATEIDNAAVGFNSPEILKPLRENRNFLMFEDIASVKVTDISLAAQKRYAGIHEKGDAFLIKENLLIRIKTVQ